MSDSAFALLPLLVPALFFTVGMITTPNGAGRVQAIRAARFALGSLVVAIVSAIAVWANGPIIHAFGGAGPLEFGIYFDTLSAIMLLLVSFLGAVVLRYSINYMDGEKRHGRFTKWLCLTIGAVLLLVISGNLLLFTLAWIATSLSLHQLLTFYPDRPGALLAARKKFLISRLGDATMIGVLALTYRTFGTADFQEIFAQAAALHSSEIPASISWISLLLVACAMMKSAQFPFHSWLPDTMETPTPVSALMHAGIINAGGFLLVRLSPVVSLSPVALTTLVLVGSFTALFASLIMLTQTSIKRSLAYSTIAQMGFMMLQCGLGAFALAVLHIVAHSLYKAHAFLTSGSIVNLAKSAWVPAERPAAHPLILAFILLVSFGITWGVGTLFGVRFTASPGVLILGSVYLMALVFFLWNLWASSHRRKLIGRGLLAGTAASAAYFGLHAGFEHLLAGSLPSHSPTPGLIEITAMLFVITLFITVLIIQAQMPQWSSTTLGRKLYVHAYKGFYFVTLANRITLALTPRAKLRQTN